jgi:MFS family permease
VITQRLLWFVPALVPLISPSRTAAVAVTLAVVSLSSLLGAAGTAPWFSWMIDLVPARMRGRFWAKRQSVTMLAFVLAMIGGGWLLDHTWSGGPRTDHMSGFTWVFGIAATLGCLDLFIHLSVPEPRASTHTRTRSILSRIVSPFSNPDFLWVTLSFGVWSFGMGFLRSFGDIYMRREFSVSYLQLAIIAISASVGTVLAGFGLGKIMDHVGSRTAAIGMVIIAPMSGVVWFLMKPTTLVLSFLPGSPEIPQPVLLMIIVNLLVGGLYSGIALCQITLCSSATRREGRTMAMAVHWTAVGLLGALGPIIGGLVMDHLSAHPLQARLPTGIRWDFIHILVGLHVAVAWFGALPLLLRVRHSGGELPVRALAGNPLRVASVIHNLIVLGESVTGPARARAVRKLGHGRTRFAVAELVASLEDPSADVREEAALALGRIGSDEAVHALLQKLQEPDSDLAPLIARALRTCGNPICADALIQRLHDDDTEMQRESARTLGVVGEPKATRPLMDLLKSTGSEKVAAAAAEALSRLGEVAAIRAILPRLKNTRNPVLRRSLAVAVGDLLGAPGRFYGLLAYEEKEPGSGVAMVLETLRRNLRRRAAPTVKHHLERLLHLIDAVEEAYEDNHWQQTAEALFTLATTLGEIHNGMEPGKDAHELLDVIMVRDPRFGMGIWVVDRIRTAPDEQLDRIDVLLCIHFVVRWWQSKHPRTTIAPRPQQKD